MNVPGYLYRGENMSRYVLTQGRLAESDRQAKGLGIRSMATHPNKLTRGPGLSSGYTTAEEATMTRFQVGIG